MNVVIVGIGRIGLVAACCLAKSGHRVVGVEADTNKLNFLNHRSKPIYEKGIPALLEQGLSSGKLTFVSSLPVSLKADIAMIAVNTPSSPDGKVDLSNVRTAVEQVREATRSPLVLVVKSTVPPGTGARLISDYLQGTPITYVANPEFLRAGQAIDDWYHPSRIVIGADNQQAVGKMLQLYSDIEAPVLVTDITSAEMIKHAANAFLSTKVSFINEIANLCQILGADIDDVIQGLGLDSRIGTAFLQPGAGYGGPCLPKDARALEFLASNKGYDFKLLKAAIEVNIRQRSLVVERLKQILGSLKGKEIALLGLAFKPNTDDVTEAPALGIANLLIAQGTRLRLYDPMAVESAKPLLPGKVVFTRDIYSAVSGACAIILATEWPEFTQADWNKIKKAMVEPCAIVDGRNALPKDKLIATGFKYVGVGR
ncbi:MAG: UDP-glucose/GDP-mannose dehydrogenase family protein [Chloroflexi bacterium]|nr:UDP-glucose/GDP-mannose dehydrogenase family protein [Chloroflexota bacterium]MBM4449662.1 UDP-glucose/GDP-mannose dehydrogenase family protein [Chloroflexota bacterium]